MKNPLVPEDDQLMYYRRVCTMGLTTNCNIQNQVELLIEGGVHAARRRPGIKQGTLIVIFAE